VHHELWANILIIKDAGLTLNNAANLYSITVWLINGTLAPWGSLPSFYINVDAVLELSETSNVTIPLENDGVLNLQGNSSISSLTVDEGGVANFWGTASVTVFSLEYGGQLPSDTVTVFTVEGGQVNFLEGSVSTVYNLTISGNGSNSVS